jgi:aspartyl-tRNA(Asn)/glutamyl-tRNA(Gln) amidotransferase subunit A
MGLVGLKPTRGAPSDEGALDEVSVVGILARCARDAAAMYTVIADRSGFDLGSPSELRLAVPRRQIDEIRLEDKVAEAFAADLQTLSDLGVRLVEIDLPHLSVARDATFVLISALNHAQWAQDLRESYTLVGPNARRYLLAGGVLAVEDFVNARRVAALFEDRLTRTITDCAGVVTPVSPVTTVEAARRPGEHNRGFDATFTAPFNAIGWPAISIPTRVGDHGLRIGVQVAARPWQEALLLELAHLLENELGLRE